MPYITELHEENKIGFHHIGQHCIATAYLTKVTNNTVKLHEDVPLHIVWQ